MHPSIETPAALYALRRVHFRNALRGLGEEELWRRISESVNPLLWIAGHLVFYRCRLALTLGLDHPLPWDHLFARGAEARDVEALPDVQQVESVWEAVSEDLMARFETLTEAELAAEAAPESFRFRDKTLRGMILFSGYHESYHIGQMALLRKWLGHGRLVG